MFSLLCWRDQKDLRCQNVSKHSALCLVIRDFIGGILEEKVHHTDKMYYNVFVTKLKKKNQDRHTVDSS